MPFNLESRRRNQGGARRTLGGPSGTRSRGSSPPLLQGSPEKAHQALEALLRGNRITIHQSRDSRDYHIEGVAELTLETHTAGHPETTGRMLLVVAGTRSDRLHTAGHPLVVKMHFSSR